MKNYKALIFDFDYTLVDATEGIVGSFNYAFSKMNFPPLPSETIKKTVGIVIEESFKMLTGCEDKAVTEEFRRHFRHKADEIMTKNTKFYPPAVRILSLLREKGIKTGIVTSKNRYRIEQAFDLYNIQRVDKIIGFEDVKNPKPAPDGLFDVIAFLNVEKEDVLYIGDTVIDAQTAKAAEIDFAGVLTGTTERGEMEKYPNVVIVNNLDELADKLGI